MVICSQMNQNDGSPSKPYDGLTETVFLHGRAQTHLRKIQLKEMCACLSSAC